MCMRSRAAKGMVLTRGIKASALCSLPMCFTMSQTVIIHRSSFLQSIASYVRLGYRHFVAGTVKAERTLSWSRKANRYYATELDRNRRARAKKRGEGCAVLLMHEHEPGMLTYVLLVTDGENPAHKLEQLGDAFVGPRLVLFGYELIRATRPLSKHPAVTWRMAENTYRARREEVIDTVRRGDDMRVRQLIHSLHAAPGFAPVRKQTYKLRALLKAEWRRVRGRAPAPAMPGKVAYLARIRIDSMPLNVYLSAIARQNLTVTTLKCERAGGYPLVQVNLPISVAT